MNALKSLQAKANRFKPDYSLIVGTNIFRRATNSKAVTKKFEKIIGYPILILSPQLEAHLEFLGATSGLKTNSKVVVIDVGGGSSEIIWGTGKRIVKKISLEIGAVRLKEKFQPQTSYDEALLIKMEKEADKIIQRLPKLTGYRLAILTGGTATTLAAFSQGLKRYNAQKVHGWKTTPAKLEKLVAKLSKLTLTDRRRVLSFDPHRADIIVPGGIILCEILRRLKIKKVVISDHGLRWGVIENWRIESLKKMIK